jgi:uncharacterized SAM-binding protein YcdF (DUF218 family)
MKAGHEGAAAGGPDAIVVLGAQVLPGGRPSTALRRRVEHGAATLQSTGAPFLVVCGGAGDEPTAEAHVMARLAERLGVERGRIVGEDESRRTLEQAERVASLSAVNGWQRVVVVTDRYHLPRALFLFRRAGLDAEGSGCGRGDGSLLRWWGGALREIPAWVKTAALAIAGRPPTPRRRAGG